MKYKIIREEIAMHGQEEMKAHWAYKKFDLVGDSIVAFVGPMKVQHENMIDIRYWGGKKKGEIFSEKMLHFIVEHFDPDTEKAILKQYMLLTILEEKLENRLDKHIIIRWKDDLFDEDKKLTVSAVTNTLVSTKIHLGINVSEKNLPTKTRSLEYYNIDPFDLAEPVIDQYRVQHKEIKEKLFMISPVIQ